MHQIENLHPTPEQFRDPDQFAELRRRAFACRGVGIKKWTEFLARHGFRERVVAEPLSMAPATPEPVFNTNWRTA